MLVFRVSNTLVRRRGNRTQTSSLWSVVKVQFPNSTQNFPFFVVEGRDTTHSCVNNMLLIILRIKVCMLSERGKAGGKVRGGGG